MNDCTWNMNYSGQRSGSLSLEEDSLPCSPSPSQMSELSTAYEEGQSIIRSWDHSSLSQNFSGCRRTSSESISTHLQPAVVPTTLEEWKAKAVKAEERIQLLESELSKWQNIAVKLGLKTTSEENNEDEGKDDKVNSELISYGHVHEFNEENPDNIRWEEEPPTSIKAASLTKLVEYLTHPTALDHNYVTAFFITCRSFTTTRMLLEKLILRYAAPAPLRFSEEQKVEWEKSKQPVIRTRVCNALRHWVEKYEHDFEDQDLRQRLNTFVNNTLEEKKMKEMLSRALEKAMNKVKVSQQRIAIMDEIRTMQRRQEALLEMMRTYEEESASTMSNARDDPPPRSFFPKTYRSPVHFLLDWPAVEIARQLTLIEFELFQRIRHQEFLNQSWNKPGKEEKAPGICALIDRFNEISRFMASIIVQLEVLEDRKSMLKKFIQIADECLSINNFNTLMAIVSGLTTPAIGRLSKTWESLNSKVTATFHNLQAVTATEKNFSVLRERMAGAPPPKLPYIGLSYYCLLWYFSKG
jgi:son of sevenless-like protein